MAKHFIKPPFNKLHQVFKSEDGYITNSEWAVKTEFIESYPSNILPMNGPLEEKALPRGEGVLISPTIHLCEDLRRSGVLFRKFATEDGSKKVWVNEDYYRMFLRYGLPICWTFYYENRPLVARTSDDRLIGIISPVGLSEKYRTLGVDC